MTHYTNEASPQTNKHVTSGGVRVAPVACIELEMVNHSIEWDRRRANRPAVKGTPQPEPA